MRKIEVEIREIDNGWVVNDSYYEEETFFSEFSDASPFAKKIISKYKRDEFL